MDGPLPTKSIFLSRPYLARLSAPLVNVLPQGLYGTETIIVDCPCSNNIILDSPKMSPTSPPNPPKTYETVLCQAPQREGRI